MPFEKEHIIEKGKFVFARTITLYLALGLILGLLLQEHKIAGNYLAHTKDFGEYAYLFSYNQEPQDEVRLRQSLAYYKALLLYMPSPALVYGNLGFCYFYLNETSQAIDHYQKAILLEPNLYTFYFDLGVISLMAKKPKLAVTLFQKSLSLLPKSDKDYLRLLGGGSPAVIKEIKLHLGRAAYDREKIFDYLSQSYIALDDHRNAQQVALEGIKLFPKNASFYYNIGVSLLMQKKYNEAVTLLSTAISIEPNYVKAYVSRAEAFKKLGLENQHSRDLRMALKKKDKKRHSLKENFTDLHVYREAGLFFKIYSLRKR